MSLLSALRMWFRRRPVGPKQTYVSNDLSHFVGRGMRADEQFDLLLKIIDGGALTHPPHDLRWSGNLMVKAGPFSSNDMYNPQIVCFCDIPIEQLEIHCRKYSPFGLSFSKTFVARQGGRPVAYVPRGACLPNHGESDVPPALIEKVFDNYAPTIPRLVAQASTAVGASPERHFVDFQLLSYIKFFDLGLDDDHPDNYYFEREWRMVSNLRFQQADIQRVIVPKGYRRRVLERFPTLPCHEISALTV